METDECKIMNGLPSDSSGAGGGESSGQPQERMFSLKKWNAVAMWSWDVECDTCAICRVQVIIQLPLPVCPDIR